MSTVTGETVLDLQSLVTVDQDIEVYVLDWPDPSETGAEIEIAVLVLLKRPEGVLLALPIDALLASKLH